MELNTAYDKARAVLTLAKTVTVSTRHTYDVAVIAYGESRNDDAKTACASAREAYLIAILAQGKAYRDVCNAHSSLATEI